MPEHPDDNRDLRLTVINPWGRDPDQDFANGPGAPGDGAHAPVNFHAYAACTGGRFLADPAAAPQDQPVLLLIRRKLKHSIKALRLLKTKVPARKVVLSFKETGSQQVAETLNSPGQVRLFQELIAEADGFIAPTQWLKVFYGGGGFSCFIPTPYPVDSEKWDFSNQHKERDILIGTREFFTPSRNHLAALCAWLNGRNPKHNSSYKLTVFNHDGKAGREFLKVLDPKGSIEVIEKRLSYPDYLRTVARHRLVFQLDQSEVPGQVAGDCLLARIPCVGGNGAIERIAFPGCNGGTDLNPADLVARAEELLSDQAAYERVSHQAGQIAQEQLSFAKGRELLEEFFSRLG